MEVGPQYNNRRWMCGVNKCNPMENTCTSPCLSAAVKKKGLRSLGGVLRKHRSHSSPVRTGVSSTNSPVRRARSPSTSALRYPIPHAPTPSILTPKSSLYNHNTDVLGAVAFYAPQPPSTPIYLVPLAARPAFLPDNPQIFDSSKQQQKRMKMKESKRVAKHIVQLILKAVAATTIARATPQGSAGLASSMCAPMTYNEHHLYHSIASQTKPVTPTKRLNAKVDVDDISSSSGECCIESDGVCAWAGDVRALRDSHVRLVLHQLRQLNEIERLNRTLRRAHVITTSRAVNLNACPNAKPACSQ